MQSGLGAAAGAAMGAGGVVVAGYGTYQQAEEAARAAFGAGDCTDADRQTDQDTDRDRRNDDDKDVDRQGDDKDDVEKDQGPRPNPHPEVAIVDDVDVETVQESIEGQGKVTWRDTREPLFRNDDRPPSVIFKEGFAPQNEYNTDLDSYVNESEPSAFVGTTSNEDFATKWGATYVYDIDAPGGIDINRTFDESPYSHEDEIAFPGGIRPEYIKGVWEVRPDGSLGKYVPNKNYRG
ncbi:hypothetical protein [Streptomyces sp. NPDC007883]|uniref:scabin-related ADP-ribosyltransferase n=1 Tax=Streptomyces sp. NPDC007883 TaxID=3155116 RepID=UPI0033FA6D24